MKKRYIFGLMLLAFIAAPYFLDKAIQPEQTLYLSPSFANTQEAHTTFEKQKPVILWDIHDCLFEKPYHAFLRKGLLSVEDKPKFLYELFKATMNKQVRTAYYYHRNRPAYSPQPYFEAAKGYKYLYRELNKQANAIYVPNKKTFKIVKELHQENCHQYLFSNIGPVTLEYLQHDYPHYFTYFNRLQNTINPITPAYDQWIQKPDTKAFNKALMSVDMHKNPQNVIFIDDREDNIK
ncbi:MAG: FMN phosphatase YigB (HAD superfamily), partial [Alteromonas naphthalenivorans]